MALQTSGAISLADIQSEFGGSNPISISEYYGVASGIPSSGSIDFADFYGKSSGPTVNRTGTYVMLNDSGGLTGPDLNIANVTQYDVFGTAIVNANAGSQTGQDIIIPDTTDTYFYKFIGLATFSGSKFTLTHMIFEKLDGAPLPTEAGRLAGHPIATISGTQHSASVLPPRSSYPVGGRDGVTWTEAVPSTSPPSAYIALGPSWDNYGDALDFSLPLGAGPMTITFDPNYRFQVI